MDQPDLFLGEELLCEECGDPIPEIRQAVGICRPCERVARRREVALKHEILQGHENENRAYLSYIRGKLRELARERGDYVTGDDARRIFEAIPGVPDDKSRNFLGAVFKTDAWETDGGTIKSSIEGRHGNRVFRWYLVEEH